MKTITDISQLDLKKRYTYADYLTWQFSDRVELIKGWIHRMSPAPRMRHQKISVELLYSFKHYFKTCDKNCMVFDAPFDVRLNKSGGENELIETVVQPDICIICDLQKLDEAGCSGAPDLIVEILSPTTAKKDYNEKFNLYEENGVLEYWIVNPTENTIEVFVRKNELFELKGLYIKDEYTDPVSGDLFPNMKVDLQDVFS
jgi:Uma2 family endonuclease